MNCLSLHTLHLFLWVLHQLANTLFCGSSMDFRYLGIGDYDYQSLYLLLNTIIPTCFFIIVLQKKKKSHAKLFRKSSPHIPEKYTSGQPRARSQLPFPSTFPSPAVLLTTVTTKVGKLQSEKGARISQASFLENYLHLILFID